MVVQKIEDSEPCTDSESLAIVKCHEHPGEPNYIKFSCQALLWHVVHNAQPPPPPKGLTARDDL